MTWGAGELARELRERRAEREQPGDPEEPSAYWRGTDRVGGDVVTSYTVILRTKGCRTARAAGCFMCGYPFEGTEGVGREEVEVQLDAALSEAPEEPLYLKLFTSGSFLDPWELPLDAQEAVLERIRGDGRAERLSVETLPRFVTEENLERLRGDHDLEVAMGLESSDDEVRRVCINKPFAFADFEEACTVAGHRGVDVKAYVLLKPPLLPEPTALIDAVESGADAWQAGADVVSINPSTVQRGTLVEHLWIRGEYRPPWLWTAHEAARQIKEVIGGTVVCDPVSAGKERGPRNCGECDDRAAEALDHFSLNQDVSSLESVECGCRDEWRERLMLEERMHHPAPFTAPRGNPYSDL